MKSFNRFLIAGGFALGASFFGVSSAMAQTTTGDIIIGGSVASTLNIAIVPVADIDDLTLGGIGTDLPETIVKVADITISTNNNAGLSLTMTEGNMDTTGGSDTPLPYQVAVTADGVAAVSGDFGGGLTENYTQDGGTAPNLGLDGTLAQDISIAYNPPQVLDAGAYTATITLTIADL